MVRGRAAGTESSASAGAVIETVTGGAMALRDAATELGSEAANCKKKNG